MKRLMMPLVLAVSLLLVIAAVPAAAKKGGKGPKPSPGPVALYDVTLSVTAGNDGLGTCGEQEPQPLTMADLGSHLSADGTQGTSMPRVHLRANIPWSRTHPGPASGDGFDGCHGGPLPGSESSIPSYFVIHEDDDGNVSNVLWAFDVYIEKGTKGKNKTPSVKEYFRLWGNFASFTDGAGEPCPATPAESVTCHVTGPFVVWHYYPIEQIGTAEFDFTLTIAPHT